LQDQSTGQLSTSISFKGVASSNITEEDFIQLMELQDKQDRINWGSGETIEDEEYIYRDFYKWSRKIEEGVQLDKGAKKIIDGTKYLDKVGISEDGNMWVIKEKMND